MNESEPEAETEAARRDFAEKQSPAMSESELASRVRRRQRRTILAAAAILVVLGVFGLGASTLSVFTLEAVVQRPTEVRWTLQEGLGVTAWGRAMLLSETGVVQAQAQGHVPGEAPLHRDGARHVALSLQPLPGIVRIEVEAADFTLSVNGKTVEDAMPAQLELPPGSHEAALSGPFLKPLQTRLEVVGFGEAQRFVLRPEPAGSFLQVALSPPEAQILLDGVPWGKGAHRAPVALGSHELVAQLSGYYSQTTQFQAQVDSTAAFEWTLRPRPAAMEVHTRPKGAAVLLNGEYAGPAPITLRLAPLRTHRIAARLANHHPVAVSVRPEPGQRMRRTLHLDGRRIQLSAHASHAADIRVNGAPVGPAPQRLTLSVGDLVEAVAPNLQAPPLLVAAAGGDQRQWTFQLLPPVEHAHRQAPEREEPAPGLALLKMPLRGLKGELTRPFMLGEREVSYDAYAQFADIDIPAGRSRKNPVTDLTWRDAARFCNWLSEKNGLSKAYAFDAQGVLVGFDSDALGYRLPTELEWEAAAGRLRPLGGAATPFANLSGRERGAARHLADYVDGYSDTAPTDAYPPNSLGLYGMAGNVAEWVTDYYADRPDPLPDDYFGPSTGIDHVVKGGSYLTFDWREVDVRRRRFVTGRQPDLGFRVARWLH